jgi:hypothetical protein
VSYQDEDFDPHEEASHKVAVVQALMKAPTVPADVHDSFPNGRVMHPTKYGAGTIADNSLMVHQSGGNLVVRFDSGHIATFPESKWHMLHPLAEINITDTQQSRQKFTRETLARNMERLAEIKLPLPKDGGA